MDWTQWMSAIDELRDLQRFRSMILCGLYLPATDLEVIESDLQPDNPPVGAVGRLCGIPVFAFEASKADLTKATSMAVGEYRGILYSYVQMDVVD